MSKWIWVYISLWSPSYVLYWENYVSEVIMYSTGILMEVVYL